MPVLPVAFHQGDEPADIKVRSLVAEVDYAGATLRMTPVFVTELSQNRRGDGWIPNNGNIAMPLTLPTDLSVEMAFSTANTPMRWGELLDRLRHPTLAGWSSACWQRPITAARAQAAAWISRPGPAGSPRPRLRPPV